jgi:hypothetical protein
MYDPARKFSVAILVCGSLLGPGQNAFAQSRVYRPAHWQHYHGFYGRPYYGFGRGWYGYAPSYGYGFSYGYGGDPYGGYLSGAANVINAQGQYLISTQQAYLEKEQVRSAMLDNRRKALDEWLYEKANAPTLNETRLMEQHSELQRALTQPPETEIWSGKTLNDLLANAQQMHARGMYGPDVPVNSGTLSDINVSVKLQGNVGLLKAPDSLKWPLALRALSPKEEATDLREQIGTLVFEAKRQALFGQVDADVLTELDRSLKKLRELLRDQVVNISFVDYTAARRYLVDLDQAVTVLKQPDAAKYVSGAYAARGHTVRELVAFMSENGLKFSPATAGEEAAYSALYQSMLRYTLAGHSISTMNPPSPGHRKRMPVNAEP